MAAADVLVLAVGNESRGDDALGPLLLRRLQTWLEVHGCADRVELLEEFQLQVEHTMDIAGRRLVLFVDAGVQTRAPYVFCRAVPKRMEGHTSHAVAPEMLLGIYDMVHGEAPPPAFVLCVAGREFELGEPLTAEAQENLTQAFDLVCGLLEQPDPAAWQGVAEVG
ncbi:MAG TPA: hydrogenase maturation protease [Methylophilaceae bacterium]|nr:hydrogenase maturation protease [Methylophilaceae bacterium]HQR59949.1 hydrogenase maturation protease [Methylophilaceae bacterium]